MTGFDQSSPANPLKVICQFFLDRAQFAERHGLSVTQQDLDCPEWHRHGCTFMPYRSDTRPRNLHSLRKGKQQSPEPHAQIVLIRPTTTQLLRRLNPPNVIVWKPSQGPSKSRRTGNLSQRASQPIIFKTRIGDRTAIATPKMRV